MTLSSSNPEPLSGDWIGPGGDVGVGTAKAGLPIMVKCLLLRERSRGQAPRPLPVDFLPAHTHLQVRQQSQRLDGSRHERRGLEDRLLLALLERRRDAQALRAGDILRQLRGPRSALRGDLTCVSCCLFALFLSRSLSPLACVITSSNCARPSSSARRSCWCTVSQTNCTQACELWAIDRVTDAHPPACSCVLSA